VAQVLDLTYLDTGAMYRSVALKALREGLDIDDPHELQALCERTVFALSGSPPVLTMDGSPLSSEIRSPEVTSQSSRISSFPEVRGQLTMWQRQIAERGGVVMEGRDIGTVVMPDAAVKVYLDANPAERAKRRNRQNGGQTDLERLIADLEKRDRADSTRALAPLKPAPDAIIIDSTQLTVDQVVQRIVDCARERAGGS
jgi:cytidylate kinase